MAEEKLVRKQLSKYLKEKINNFNSLIVKTTGSEKAKYVSKRDLLKEVSDYMKVEQDLFDEQKKHTKTKTKNTFWKGLVLGLLFGTLFSTVVMYYAFIEDIILLLTK